MVSSPSPASPVVLLAHADAAFREKVRSALEVEGYRVVEATDGEMGLTRAGEEKPSLLIVDPVLPRLSGAAMIRKLRQAHEWARAVPVLAVIDARTQERDVDEMVVVDEHLSFVKADWDVGHIVAKMKEVLAPRARAPRGAG